jgi:hypothetical protein
VVTLPIRLSREALKNVPEDRTIEVGFYPPEDFDNKAIGIGFVSRENPWYEETKLENGLYYHKNVASGRTSLQISTTKNPRYFALMQIVADE